VDTRCGVVVLAAIWAALPAIVRADDVAVLNRHPNAIASFVEQEDRLHRGVFFSSCDAPRPEEPGRTDRFVLIVEQSGVTSYLFVWLLGPDPVVANAATLKLAGGRFEITEHMGGLWSREWLGRAADALGRLPFRLTSDYPTIVTQENVPACGPLG